MRKLRKKKHKSSKKFIKKTRKRKQEKKKERCIHIKKENEAKRKKVQACPEQMRKNPEFLLLNKDQVNTIKAKSMYFFEATSSFLHILRWDYHSATLEKEQTGMERCQRPDKLVLVR